MKKRLAIILVLALVISLCAALPISAEKDLAQTISLPKALIKGHSYDLQFAEMSLSVNGESCDGSFVAEGAQAVLQYTDDAGTEIGTYTLPVLDTKESGDQCAYFYDPSGAITAVENENDIALSFEKDSEISFINQLNAEDVSLYLSFVEDATNFGKVRITLTDAADATVSVSFAILLENKIVSRNNESAKLGEFRELLQLRYKNSSGKLMQGTDVNLLKIEKDDSGKEFNGFSGGVYMTVGFEAVTGNSTVKLTRVNNQALGHKSSTAVDMAEPTMALTSPLRTTQLYGETFEIPTFAAYDVLSQVAESSVEVEAPDGTVHTEPFAIDQYGKYKMTFRAEDVHGNKMKVIKMVFVNDDQKPELQVSQLEKTTYSLGDKVTVPGYTVSDNLGVYNVDVILFLPNYEIRLLTHDANGEIKYCLSDSSLYSSSFIADNTSFKTEQVGTYTLRYVAYDDQHNRTVQELTFQVQ